MKLTQLLYGSLKAASDEEFYFLGLNAFLEGELEKAKEYFTECARKNTDHAESYFQLGRVYEQLGQTPRAIKILQDLTYRTNLEPDFKNRILRKTLELYLGQNMGDEALKLFKIHWLKTKDIELLKMKLAALKMSGIWGEASNLAVKLYKAKEITSSELAFVECKCALENENPKQKLKDLYKVLRSEPQCSLAWAEVIQVNRNSKNHKGLIEDWRNWFRHCPKDALENLHQFEDDLFEANQYNETLRIYQECFHHFSTPPASLVHALVRGYAKIGAEDAIHDIFEKLIPMAENDPKHHLQTLLQVYVEYEKNDASSQKIRQALLKLFKENIQIKVEGRE